MPKERKILQIDSSSSNLRKPHILRLKQFLNFFLRQWSIGDSGHAEKHKRFLKTKTLTLILQSLQFQLLAHCVAGLLMMDSLLFWNKKNKLLRKNPKV